MCVCVCVCSCFCSCLFAFIFTPLHMYWTHAHTHTHTHTYLCSYAKAKEMVGDSVELAQNKASQIAAMGLSKGIDAAEKVYDATKAVSE